MTDESGGGILSSEEEDTLRKIVGDSVTLRLDRYFGLTNNKNERAASKRARGCYYMSVRSSHLHQTFSQEGMWREKLECR